MKELLLREPEVTAAVLVVIGGLIGALLTGGTPRNRLQQSILRDQQMRNQLPQGHPDRTTLQAQIDSQMDFYLRPRRAVALRRLSLGIGLQGASLIAIDYPRLSNAFSIAGWVIMIWGVTILRGRTHQGAGAGESS